MRNFFSHAINYHLVACLLMTGLLAALSGCGLMEIKEQTSILDNMGVLKGKIEVTSPQKGIIWVLRYADEDNILVLKQVIKASKNGEYKFLASPGQHYIAAFIDVNGDEKYQPEEHGNFYGLPTPIPLGAKETVSVDTITISGPVPEPATEVKLIDRTAAIWENIGQVVTLDDARFTPDNYIMGLWRPIDFLDTAEGGLFFLEKYQKKKIPVLFVHGVAGGPTQWADVIASMDREHFQPWLFYYPSSFRLDTISDFLVTAVSKLQAEYQFKEFYVVAHSMGGLVTRSFVKKYVESDPQNAGILRLVMTVNSPMNGMTAASAGVEHSPVIVPSWRDVAPGSEFLQGILSWDWPKEIEYHLVVSYLDGESGDGVVSLQSQAQLRLQSEATRIYILNNAHAQTFKDKDFHAILNRALENRRNN